MAPFAFLGPDHDDALRQFYTTTRSADIFTLGSLLWQLLAGEALGRHAAAAGADRAACRCRAAARAWREAHHRGRRLYIGTADIDVPRFVVWNMGLIASSDHPDALELFRKVMLASASIPVAFPPVLFEVELHAGRTAVRRNACRRWRRRTRVPQRRGVPRLGDPRTAAGRAASAGGNLRHPQRSADTDPGPVNRSLAGDRGARHRRLGRVAAIGDLFRIYSYAQREQAGFRWVTIPNDVNMDADEIFDPAKMQMLYDVGFRMAASSDAWSLLPPGRRLEP